MKKYLKGILITFCAVMGTLILLLAVSAILYTPEYILRCIRNGESEISDYQVFPERAIQRSASPYRYEEAPDSSIDALEVSYTIKGEAQAGILGKTLEDLGTTSLLVVHNDKLVYEKYLNGYQRDSVETSFSSIKSLNSLMIGIAIEDGFIQSEDQAISEFLPELKGTAFEDITLKNLLMMRSIIRYEEGSAWFGDDAKTYYYPDLRNLALHHMAVDKDYAGQFHYNNYHPLLMGMILERCTDMHVADYFQTKIWEKVGAEYDASWSLDSEKTGFEKMESGLNFRSVDYAKIGSMLLHRGAWNGQTVIGEEWLDRSVIAPEPLAQSDIDSPFLQGKNVGYQYMWYSIDNNSGGKDFFAAGKYGQYLYVSPDNDTLIVRTGISTGGVDWWPDVLRDIAAYTGSR